jgi:hypothetical protein
MNRPQLYLSTLPIPELAKEVEEAEQNAKVLRDTLAARRRACQHTWSPTKYEPIIHEGYEDPGDPPGTMGVDRRLPMWVPREEIPVWKRTCEKCGTTEETRRTRDDVKKIPVF